MGGARRPSSLQDERMKCCLCENHRTGELLPRDWRVSGRLVLCRECRHNRYRLRSITTAVLDPVGATWPELRGALEQSFGEKTPVFMPEGSRQLTIAEGYAVVRVFIAERWWPLRLNSAKWSAARRDAYRKIMEGEAVAGELLLYRGPKFGAHLQNRFNCDRPPRLVCRIAAWLPRDRPEDVKRPEPALQDQDIELMDINRLRRAVRSNRVTFPSQVPTFPGCHGADLQCRLAHLYFVLGWSCGKIAERYRLVPQQVRRVLNVWKQRAAKAGYIQHIPPAEVMSLGVEPPVGQDTAIDDYRLMAGIQAGDESAWEKLIERFQTPVYNLACHLLGDPRNAGKAAQEAFLRIFRNAGVFQGGSGLRAWIYRTAVQECNKMQCRIFGQGGEAIFDFTANRNARVPIAEALAAVDPLLRSALVLREIEDLGYEEIAEILEISVAAAKSRIVDGREALRRKLATRVEPADSAVGDLGSRRAARFQSPILTSTEVRPTTP